MKGAAGAASESPEFQKALLRIVSAPETQFPRHLEQLLHDGVPPEVKAEQASERGAEFRRFGLDADEASENIKALRIIAKSDKYQELLQSIYRPLNQLLQAGTAEREKQWVGLAAMCRTLERLAYKQLRKMEFSEADREFIRGYGPHLAWFYECGSYIGPPDNAPKAATLASFQQNAAAPAMAWEHAALGRPWSIYVLYPWQGKELLCRGGVFSYYEPLAARPLTDAEWQERLDAPSPPQLPAWTAPVVSPEPHAKGKSHLGY